MSSEGSIIMLNSTFQFRKSIQATELKWVVSRSSYFECFSPGLLASSILLCRSISSLLFDPADGQQELLGAQGRLVWTGLLPLGCTVLLLRHLGV